MSAIAGRVLLIPKGNYDSTATYTMLDMVVYNGSSYICKQECTGVVPTNTTYWMLNASGSAVAFLNDIGDVVITNVSNGQVLMYNSTTRKWVNGTISTTLSGLSDTQIASLSNGQVLKYNATSQKWENADEKGGILPHLIVISETGSTVTATKGQTVITATETSTGHFECDLTEFGTWTIDAILGGDDAQVSLVVDTVKVYTVDDSHFHADITVKYPSGATCNLAGQGESYYATGSPYTFTVHHAGQYTITVVYNGQTYTETVTVTTTGETISEVVPSPSSAPANDINFWLWFGNVSGSYSTLADILADSTALSTLMASTDAVDYLVRCTNWISDICGNQSAMSYIGLNNYCANTLLADEDWLDGIGNSTYMESVLNVKVPTMTSDTTPSGECIGTVARTSSNAIYKAFDGNDATYSQYDYTQPDSTNPYTYSCGYNFGSSIRVKYVKGIVVENPTTSPTAITLHGSNDGITWSEVLATVTDTIPLGSASPFTITPLIVSSNAPYTMYKMKFNFGNSQLWSGFYTLQFYGREDV